MASDGDNKKLKEKIRGYSNAMNAMEYEAALDQYYTNKRNEENVAALKDRSARDQWLANEEIRQLKILSSTDQYDKSQKLYETTLDAIDLAARDAEDRVRLGLDEQIAEFAFQYDDLERDMFKEAQQAGLQYDQKQQSLESARITDMVTQEQLKLERKYKQIEYREQLEQNRLQKRSTKLSKQSQEQDLRQNRNARRNTKEQIKQNKWDKKKTSGDIRKQMFDQTLENIQATGAARAKGQIGQSTKRAVTTANALNGINQQQLEDNLYFAQKTYDSQKRQLKNQRDSQLSDRRKINLQGKQLDVNLQQTKSQRKTIKASREKELGKGVGRLKVGGFEKFSLKGAAKRGGTLGLQMAQSRQTKKLTKKQVEREQDYIAQQLGITQEEFEMSREKLAESLQSAAAQSELKLKNIKTKEFEAQGQAYAAKMVKPRFGDKAKLPYETPKTQFVLPKPAPKTPMMQGNMGRGANRPASGASLAMGIGSTALAIGAGFATGGTATALMGASGVLGGLSALFS